MCKNGRNRCSVWVAMDKHGDGDEAARIFALMVNSKNKKEK